jgi:disulfide oxidoreductase YuzD
MPKQPKPQPRQVQWLDDAIDDDYSAAAHYLSLLDIQKNIDKAVAEMRSATITEFKAADLLRAAQLTVPKADDRPTREQIKKIKNGEAVSPVLLMRASALKKVIIADGFHRVCAAYRIDPDVVLHCKLAGT